MSNHAKRDLNEERLRREFDELCERFDKPKAPLEKPKAKEAEVIDLFGHRRSLTQWEYQRIIDQTWERVSAERREKEREMGRLCHRGPGDPDYTG
jgi:hypothetical protein